MGLRLDVYSHHFAVSGFDQSLIPTLRIFAQRYTLYKYEKGGRERKIDAVYAAKTKNWSYLRLHINVLDAFKTFLDYSGYRNNYTVNEVPLHEPAYCEFPVVTSKEPREIQPDIIRYIVEDGKVKTIPLQTGKGKTLCTCMALSQIQQRTVVMIRPMYAKRWEGDLLTSQPDPILGLKEGKDYYYIGGSKALRNLIALAKMGGITQKLFIFSNKTVQLYLKHGEENDGDWSEYGCEPWNLFQLLGIGVLVRDEVHLDFHLNFLTDLYFHVPKTINLSATLENDNPELERMYELMLPKQGRVYAGEYDKYTEVTCLMYSLQFPSKVRWNFHGNPTYSHVAFEYSILKNKGLTDKWFSFIVQFVQTEYVEKHQEPDKFILFAATVEMCTKMSERIQMAFPDLKVFRYVSEDEYEGIYTADIVVSTVLSAGTAVDIPNLMVILMTNALGSKQSNLQVLGRCRKPKDYPERIPRFFYMTCMDIAKHMEFHYRKQQTFENKVLSHIDVYTDLTL